MTDIHRTLPGNNKALKTHSVQRIRLLLTRLLRIQRERRAQRKPATEPDGAGPTAGPGAPPLKTLSGPWGDAIVGGTGNVRATSYAYGTRAVSSLASAGSPGEMAGAA